MAKEQKYKVEEEGPYLDISATGPRIKTLPKLLEVTHANLEDFEITNYEVNVWEQSQKQKGSILPILISLFQVKANLRRKVIPMAKWSIRPVQVCLTHGGLARSRRKWKRVKQYLLWSDPHFGFKTDEKGNLIPFHDERALRALLVLMIEEKFCGSYCLGDLLDLCDFSDKFPSEPNYHRQTQHALSVADQWLLRLNTLSLVEGNHDQRAVRRLLKFNQAAYNLRRVEDLEGHPAGSIPDLLCLKEHGIEWVGGYPQNHKTIGDVHLIHGDVARAQEGATTKKYLNDTDLSVAFGHIHRTEISSRFTNGRQQVAMSVGCTCRLDGVVPGHRPLHQHWSQGGGVLTVYSDGSTMLEVVPIVDGVAYWRGKEYRAEDVD